MSILTSEGLIKDFFGLRAIDKLNISIEKGQIHSLIGPNGSGKTTFINLVTGLFPVTEGKIYFNSTDITNLKPYTITQMGIGRTFQKARVMDRMSCKENVMAGLYCHTKTDIVGTYLRLPFLHSAQEDTINEKALELLQFVGLQASAERSASELVWVEHQLLQIARALATEPKLILLDEPTAGMGLAETEQVQKIIHQIREKGITVLIISHDINLVTHISDFITVIEFGKKIAEGTPTQIHNNPDVIEVYLGKEES
jgi:branched-chain amino acid transport system ATP-binding protein